MSVSALFNQSKDVTLIAWLCTLKLKITSLLENSYRYIKIRAHAWLQAWISVRTALSVTSFISKLRNKHAILVGLATIAAVIFTWKSNRSRELKPCPAPQETKDNPSKGMLSKSLQESIAPTTQLDVDENILPVQQDLHVTHLEATALSSALVIDMATGNRDVLSSEYADVKETFVFDKRQLEDSTRGPQNYRILYPVSTLLQPQPFNICEQGGILDEMKSDRIFEDQLLHMHNKEQKEDSELYRILNSTKNENAEFQNNLGICNEPPAFSKDRNVCMSSWQTPESPSDMTSINFSPEDVTATIQNFPRSNIEADAMVLSKTSQQYPVMEGGMHKPFLRPFPYNENYADQSSVPTEMMNSPITNFQDIKSHSVTIMVGEHTTKGLQYENNVPLSHSVDVIESLHDVRELSRFSPFNLAHKLEHSTLQGPDMFKLIHSTGDMDRSNCNVRLSQGSYQEKLRTYDKYLADPKLSAQMRSQVERAKVYLQRYYEVDGH